MMKKIHTLVEEATKNQLSDMGNSVTISQKLNLSRNMASQYLNQLFSEGYLIKINTRPVIFYDIKTVENLYHIHVEEKEFLSFQAFQSILHPKKLMDFEKLIGFEESLQSVVNQCKATISYPPNGLPLLLYGPTGTGKSYMAQLMYEYALHHSLIEENKKLLIVNCSEYANNPELLTANLFGHKKGAYTGADKDNPGLLKLAEGGILFLDEVHCLKAECQEKLFLFMDKGIYHMVGDNEKWYQSNVRLLFATTEKPEEVLLKTLLRRIPMIVTIPSLDERGTHERLQLIYSIYKSEEQRIEKSIFISTLVYQILLSSSFEGNIGELKNAIQASCVNALFESKPDLNRLEIRAYNLPEKLVKKRANQHKLSGVEQQKMISIHELQKFVHHERPIIKFYEQLLKNYALEKEFSTFLNINYKCIEEYYEMIVLKANKNFRKHEYIQGFVQSIFEMLSSRYGFKYANNNLIAISAYISDIMANNFELENWKVPNKKDIHKLSNTVRNELAREYAIAKEIEEHLSLHLDIEFDELLENVIALTLKMLNHEQDLNKRVGIIISHGFSTASSISDAVNKLLGKFVFDAIDMPLHVSTKEIIEQLSRYLRKIGSYEELFLLVDMGSLEEIHKGIQNQHATIGIMNNVTTKLALEIGQGILNGTPMQALFKQVKDYSLLNYHIVEHQHKEKIILCSCASGMGTAEKLKTILKDSLPHNLPMKVLTYDYNSLLDKQMHASFFENYEVICIVGTLNPNIEGIRFIPIEDLIINDTLAELTVYFKDYINEEEMETFQQNILRNFSLSNIMNNLTILNPNKLLEHVANAIDLLQLELNIRFTNNTCVGLYVHICCLIERLVTNQSIDIYSDIKNFEKKELAFINSVKKSFSVVEKYYSVVIPVEEIGYIFNYVKNN